MLLKILKWIGYFVLAVLVIGLFLPGKSHVERSIETSASVETLKNQILDYKNWNNWSPWYDYEPTAKQVFSEPTAGLGAWYTWDGKEVGKGKMTTMDITANTIRQKLEFDSSDPSTVGWKLEPQSNGNTKITWSLDSEYGFNVISRYFGLMIDKFIGPDYEKGLSKLKSYSEANPAPAVVPPAPVANDSTKTIKK